VNAPWIDIEGSNPKWNLTRRVVGDWLIRSPVISNHGRRGNIFDMWTSDARITATVNRDDANVHVNDKGRDNDMTVDTFVYVIYESDAMDD
jgi:hypothetical protein